MGLPKTYRAYEMLFGPNVAVDTREIEYMLTFKDTERLLIFDRANVAVELNKRVEQFKAFKRLYHLELSIQPDSYEAIDLTRFLQRLPALKVANFRADGLTPEQFDEFVRRQKVPKGWRLHVSPKGISYTRNTKNAKDGEASDIIFD